MSRFVHLILYSAMLAMLLPVLHAPQAAPGLDLRAGDLLARDRPNMMGSKKNSFALARVTPPHSSFQPVRPLRKSRPQRPALTGEGVVGLPLTLTLPTPAPTTTNSQPTPKIIWYRDGYPIKGADQFQYIPGQNDIGKIISVMRISSISDSFTLTFPRPIEDALLFDLSPHARPPQNEFTAYLHDQPPNQFSGQHPDHPPAQHPNQFSDQLPDHSPRLPVLTPAMRAAADGVPTHLTKGLYLNASAPRHLSGLFHSPSRLLPPSILDSIESHHIGAPLDLKTINALIAQINQAYMDAGFALARALLPTQTITDGRLRLELVETKIGKFIIEGAHHVDEDFIRSYFPFRSGDYIALDQLERAIRLYNANNQSQLKSSLAAGEHFGESDIFIHVTEPVFAELTNLSIDNYATEMSDWQNNALTLQLHNLLGRDDEISFSQQKASGARTYGFSYAMPLAPNGTNISASFSTGETMTKGSRAELIGYKGSARSHAVSLSTPLISTDEYALYLMAAYSASYNELTQPVTGAMLSGTRGRKFTLSLPLSYKNQTTSLAFSPAIHSINLLTAIPRQEIWAGKIDGDFTLSHFVTPRLTANLRGRFLYTDSGAMLNMPSEILSVGGPNNVRAYQPAESSGYQGFSISGEMRTDLAQWRRKKLPAAFPSIQPYIFIDHMLARSRYKQDRRDDYWSGAGIGLTIPKLLGIFSFDAYIAEPLDGDTHALEQQAYNDQFIQFSLKSRIPLHPSS